MRVNIQAVTPSTMHTVEPEAAVDMFWQSGETLPLARGSQEHSLEVAREANQTFDKQIWMQNTHLTWGICGYTAFVDNGDAGATPVPAATVFFAPTKYLPGVGRLPTGPVSPDAILLTTVHVSDAYMGLYLEHQLIDTVITEATRRGVKAIEAFARAEEFDDSIVQRALDLAKDPESEIPRLPRGGELGIDSMDSRTDCGEGLPYANTREERGREADADREYAQALDIRALTPLQELRFIPEAYRGWDHEPRTFRTENALGNSKSEIKQVAPKTAGQDQRRFADGAPTSDLASPSGGVSNAGGARENQRGLGGGGFHSDISAEAGQGAVIDTGSISEASAESAAVERGMDYDSEHDSLEWAPILSEDILEEEGFRIVSHHPKYPRYRRELPDATNLFGRFDHATHEKLNGPEHIHTVLGGDSGHLSPLRTEFRAEAEDI